MARFGDLDWEDAPPSPRALKLRVSMPPGWWDANWKGMGHYPSLVYECALMAGAKDGDELSEAVFREKSTDGEIHCWLGDNIPDGVDGWDDD